MLYLTALILITITVIDISQLEPNDENRIVAELNTSGTYILKGSNFINEAYVDATIYVPRGVTANVILDGVNIDNDDGGRICRSCVSV